MKHVNELFLYYKDTTFFAHFQAFRQLYYDTIWPNVDIIRRFIDEMWPFFRPQGWSLADLQILRALGESPQTPQSPPAHPVGGVLLWLF